jgi:Leucine-rich repeat (LRR) protein
MFRNPTVVDIVFVSQYALRMIDAMPDTMTEIKISGDMLYAYSILNPNIRDPNTPLLSYDDYKNYCDKLIEILTISPNIATHEEHIQSLSTITFNKLRDKYYRQNIHINACSGEINLSRFTQLENFYIYQIFFKSIKKIPSSLKYLSCKSCNISRLSKLPKSLNILNCTENHIKHLPALYNTQLQSLFCSGNRIQRIPKLPNTIEWLYCYNNDIYTLPDILPKSLEILSCTNNNITILPELPNKITGLYVEHNYIKTIPSLPKTLIDCFFGDNRVKKMTELPVFLKRITCYDNPINEFVPLPPSVIYANIHGTVMEL